MHDKVETARRRLGFRHVASGRVQSMAAQDKLSGIESSRRSADVDKAGNGNTPHGGQDFFTDVHWSADGTSLVLTGSSHAIYTYILPPDLLDPSDSEHGYELSPHCVHDLPEPSYATVAHPSWSLNEPETCLTLTSLRSLPIRLTSPFTPGSGIVASYPFVNPTTEAYISPHSLLFSPHDPNIFFAGAANATLAIFDLQRPGNDPEYAMRLSGASRHRRGGGGSTKGLASPAVSQMHMQTLVSGEPDGSVVESNTHTAHSVKGIISALAMNRSGSSHGMLAVGTFSGSVGLVDARAGSLVNVFHTKHAPGVLPDDKVKTNDPPATLIPPSSYHHLHSTNLFPTPPAPRPHSQEPPSSSSIEPGRGVTSLHFHPTPSRDNYLLVSSRMSNALLLYDTRRLSVTSDTGKNAANPVAILTGHKGMTQQRLGMDFIEAEFMQFEHANHENDRDRDSDSKPARERSGATVWTGGTDGLLRSWSVDDAIDTVSTAATNNATTDDTSLETCAPALAVPRDGREVLCGVSWHPAGASVLATITGSRGTSSGKTGWEGEDTFSSASSSEADDKERVSSRIGTGASLKIFAL